MKKPVSLNHFRSKGKQNDEKSHDLIANVLRNVSPREIIEIVLLIGKSKRRLDLIVLRKAVEKRADNSKRILIEPMTTATFGAAAIDPIRWAAVNVSSRRRNAVAVERTANPSFHHERREKRAVENEQVRLE